MEVDFLSEVLDEVQLFQIALRLLVHDPHVVCIERCAEAVAKLFIQRRGPQIIKMLGFLCQL